MKLSPAAKYGIAGLGFVLLLCIGLILFATSGSNKTAGIVNPTECEYCGGKLNKNGDCPKCMVEMGPAKYRAKRESRNWYNSPLIPSIIIGLLCVLLAVHIAVLLYQFSRRKKAEVFYHVRCLKCGRKLRYRDSQINHVGRCPLCQKPIRFPEPVQARKSRTWGISWRKIREMVWD